MRHSKARIIAVCAVVLGLAPPLEGQAAAQSKPVCSADSPAAVRLDVPSAVAYNRSTAFYFDWIGKGRTYVRDSVRLTVGPAGSAPFAESYEAPYRRNWRIEAAPGDGDALIKVSYLEYDDKSGRANACRRVLRERVDVGPGFAPVVRTRVLDEDLLLDLRGTGDCFDALRAPVRFRLRGGGVDEAFTVKQICGGWDRGGFRTRGLAVRTKGVTVVSYPLFRVKATSLGRDARRRFTATATLGGERIAFVRFEVRWFQYSREVVYEGEPEFRTVCAEEGRTIRRRGGRLYCVRPAANYQVVEIIRRS